MIAQAFVKDDINSLLNDGLAAINPNSQINNIVKEVRLLHKTYPDNWRKARQLIKAIFYWAGRFYQQCNGKYEREYQLHQTFKYEINTHKIIQAILSLILSKNNLSIRNEIFIDTANLSQIKEANEFDILDGVTTNPSLMAKEGIHLVY